MMYDFITGNDMVITDHVHVQYTYFCDSNNTRTWIDHCLSPASALSMVKSCRILPYEPSNVSDHLPITITLHLPYTCPGSASEPGKSPSSAVHADLPYTCPGSASEPGKSPSSAVHAGHLHIHVQDLHESQVNHRLVLYMQVIYIYMSRICIRAR